MGKLKNMQIDLTNMDIDNEKFELGEISEVELAEMSAEHNGIRSPYGFISAVSKRIFVF